MYAKGKFWGELNQLKYFVNNSGVWGNWWEPKHNMHQFSASNGGCLMWWPSKHTMVMQGHWMPEDEAAIKGEIKFGPYKPQPVAVPDATGHVRSILADLNEAEEYFVMPDVTPFVDALMAEIH
ncbi:MAG: hypothetical protein OCC46_08035 [Pseudodesulfovibrio sp.]